VSERRLLALVALLLGLLGALLVLLGFRLPRDNQPFLDWLGGIAVKGILGLVALLGSLIIFGGQYRAGGILNIIIGIALLLVGASTAGSLLVVFSGVLGLVAAGTFDEYRHRR
jgi:hypothetical protein